MLPGLIVRCPREAAEYAPSPPSVDPTDRPTPPRSRGRSPSPSPASPRASREKLRSSPVSATPTHQKTSGNLTAVHHHHLQSSPPRTIVSSSSAATAPTRQPVAGRTTIHHGRRVQSPPRRSGGQASGTPRLSPNASPSRTSAAPAKQSPSPKRSAKQLALLGAGVAPTGIVIVGDASPKAKKSGTPSVGTPSVRRGSKKGRGQQTTLEVAAAAMKAEFEAEPGDCVLMVVAVNGVRPQPPRLARSLEGYCIVVSHSAQYRYLSLGCERLLYMSHLFRDLASSSVFDPWCSRTSSHYIDKPKYIRGYLESRRPSRRIDIQQSRRF